MTPFTYRARIVRWKDGDTPVVDIDQGFDDWKMNQSLRMYGIDTPELKPKWSKYKRPVDERTCEARGNRLHPGHKPEPCCYDIEAREAEIAAAKAAKARCEELAPPGSMVVIHTCLLYTSPSPRDPE